MKIFIGCAAIFCAGVGAQVITTLLCDVLHASDFLRGLAEGAVGVTVMALIMAHQRASRVKAGMEDPSPQL
jgi:hypothetical protein